MKQETPRANRFHIGLFGRRNVGKSSIVNALTGQPAAVVSDVPGTTTDAVMKNMELPQVGAAVLVDTAGFDDEGRLGMLRTERTVQAAARVDLALLVVAGSPAGDAAAERQWAADFRSGDTPVILVYNKTDADGGKHAPEWEKLLALPAVRFSAATGEGTDALLAAVAAVYNRSDEPADLLGSLVSEGDRVVLVMPQDEQAPRGRLILPQVQTLRCLLDRKCQALCCTPDTLPALLSALCEPPSLVITDSQAFAQVEPLCPQGTRLTSFSVLFARQKGDIRLFLQGAEVLERLAPDARILIAEACTHVPRGEDIGRVKLPRLLRRRYGDALRIDIVSGNDFPADLSAYDLMIHCGACMFTRRHVLARLRHAQACSVPVTNYGIAIAALSGILPRIAVPCD